VQKNTLIDRWFTKKKKSVLYIKMAYSSKSSSKGYQEKSWIKATQPVELQNGSTDGSNPHLSELNSTLVENKGTKIVPSKIRPYIISTIVFYIFTLHKPKLLKKVSRLLTVRQ
jgi:hypothetical protein